MKTMQRSARTLCQLAFLFLLGTAAAQAQSTPQVAGYLSRVPASGLRFAPPPKPPVAQLALSGIRADPSPYLNNKFLTGQPQAESKPIDLHFLDPQKPRRADSSTPVLALASSVITPDMEVLSPQALIRFFEPKPNAVPSSAKSGTAFKVPIKPDSEAGTK